MLIDTCIAMCASPCMNMYVNMAVQIDAACSQLVSIPHDACAHRLMDELDGVHRLPKSFGQRLRQHLRCQLCQSQCGTECIDACNNQGYSGCDLQCNRHCSSQCPLCVPTV